MPMSERMLSLSILVLSLLVAQASAATDPVTQDMLSTRFAVSVDGKPVSVYSYEDMDFLTFPWQGKAKLSITRLDGKPIAEARVRPVRLGIPSQISQANLSFEMDSPRHLVISIDLMRKLVIVPQLTDPDFPDLNSKSVINVKNIGADPTGKTDNTQLLQQAIDGLPTDGTLYFPAGHYRTGSLELKSDMTLYVDRNAIIKGSDDFKQHKFRGSYLYFIRAENAQNIRILGHGTVDANGGPIRRAWQIEKAKRKVAGRCFLTVNVKNLTIKNTTFRESYSWNMHFVATDNLYLDRVKVFSSMTNSNGDGLDIDGCHDVLVENCLIFAEDDAITPKGAWLKDERRDARNFVIRDCVLWSQMATGIRLGAETYSHAFANMTFENIDFLRANTMIRIYNYDGADIHDIVFKNMWVEEYTLYVQDLGFDEIDRIKKKRDEGQTYFFYVYHSKRTPESQVGLVRNVLIENIHADRIVKSKLYGLDRPDGQKSISNITFKNYIVNGQCITDPKTLKISSEGNAESATVICE
jgi:polygalacturonase